MPESTTTESVRREPGVVEALARDDVERKKFLTMAGRKIGAGAATAGLAAFVAACGSATSRTSRTSGPPKDSWITALLMPASSTPCGLRIPRPCR